SGTTSTSRDGRRVQPPSAAKDHRIKRQPTSTDLHIKASRDRPRPSSERCHQVRKRREGTQAQGSDWSVEHRSPEDIDTAQSARCERCHEFAGHSGSRVPYVSDSESGAGTGTSAEEETRVRSFHGCEEKESI
ncbi:hypothetical protein LTR16_010801, partial [Cryomyces antarcticus]